MSHITNRYRASGQGLRVLLVYPSKRGGVVSTTVSNEDDFGVKPPLGLLYMGTCLRDWGGHEVQVVDAAASGHSPEAVAEIASAYRPDLIGLGAETFRWFNSAQMGRMLREVSPDAHICVGGPHVGLFPAETLAQPWADSVVAGDGELPILALAKALADGDPPPRGVAGLYCEPHGVPAELTYSTIGDVNLLPIPDRSLLPPRARYGSVFSRTGMATTMVSTRGCPAACGFCKLDKLMRYSARDADIVVQEFEHIARLGYAEVELYDDTFSIRRDRVRAICEGLIERDLGLEWSVRDRVNTLRPDNVELMVKAGCKRIHFGIESGNLPTLKKMKKNISLAAAREAVHIAREAGLTVVTHFIVGYLDETREMAQRTLDFALELDADFSEFSILEPLPGTPVYSEGLDEGYWSDYWREYALDPTPDFELIHYTGQMSLTEVRGLRDTALRRFYFRPRYIARRIRGIDSVGELRRQARMGFNLAGAMLKGGLGAGMDTLLNSVSLKTG